MPRQFHRAFIDALRSIERVELRALANSLLTDVIGVEHGVANDTLYAIGSGGAGTQRLLGIGHARRGVHLVLPVGVLVGGAVLPAHGTLVVGWREGVDGVFLVVDVDAELVAEAFGIGVGIPGEDDAVRQLFYLEVLDGHRAGGVHGDAGLRVVATGRHVPEVRYIIYVIDRLCLIAEAGIGVCTHVLSELGYLFPVAIDHPLVVGIIAGDSAYAPREVHLLVALVEHALQVGGFDNGRVDGHPLADDITVVGKGVARVCAIKTRVHLIAAYVRGCGHNARPTAVIHPEHRVADVIADWIIGYQPLTIAVVGKVRGVGGFPVPLRLLRGEVLMDEDVWGTSSFVRVKVATVRTVAP